MVNIKDLRVSNLVSINGKYCVVQTIGTDHIQYDSVDGLECAETCSLDHVEVVSLHPDILPALGLERNVAIGDANYVTWYFKGYRVMHQLLNSPTKFVSAHTCTNIDGVHHLQNLIWEMFRKEVGL